MMMTLNVFAVDDHMVVLEGYSSIFKMIEGVETLNFTKAADCRSAFETIESRKNNPFTIAVLDYSIPEYAEKGIYSGYDVALHIRKTMPECKIIMMTMHKEVEIMNSILINIKPEGFINKSDCDTEEISNCFLAVLAGETCYSKTITAFIKRQENGILLDEVDTKIITLLSKGIKTKNLGKYIPLSDSAIEKRKYKVKKMLDVNGDDETLVNEARKQGFI